jgi:hypothetical protein
MRVHRRCLAILAAAAAFVLVVQDAALAQAQTPAPATETMKLSISKDGTSIVDQDGKVVAHFVPGMSVRTPEAGNTALQGCFRCTDDCVIYEGSRCVKTIRSCTWDFDCK